MVSCARGGVGIVATVASVSALRDSGRQHPDTSRLRAYRPKRCFNVAVVVPVLFLGAISWQMRKEYGRLSVSFVFKPKSTGRVPSHTADQLQQMAVSEQICAG